MMIDKQAMDEMYAQYVFLKTAGFTKMPETTGPHMEKEADIIPWEIFGRFLSGLMKAPLNIYSVGAEAASKVLSAAMPAATQIAETASDVLFTKAPLLTGGLGLGLGGAWWLANKNKRFQNARHLARMRKLRKRMLKYDPSLVDDEGLFTRDLYV